MDRGVIMEQQVGRSKLEASDVYDLMAHQAREGDWTRGFTLRDPDDDPWSLGVFDPDRVAFTKPPEAHDKVTELRAAILELVRPFFITEHAWDLLTHALRALYTNPALCHFMEERRGNLFLVTPHVQFHDLGIVAAASMQVRAELAKDNPFASPEDPGQDQTIVANRVLTMLNHEAFRQLTSLPVMEGLMLPLADVVTTISAHGSGQLVRRILGRDLVSVLNGQTREHLVQRATKGSQLIMLAPSGSQARLEEVDRYSSALVVGEASRGTADLIVDLNHGEDMTRRNAVAGLFLDCPSIRPNGAIEPQEAGVALCRDVWVPTDSAQLEYIMKATLRTGVGKGRRFGPEFRYGTTDDDGILRRHQLAALDRAKLTEVVGA